MRISDWSSDVCSSDLRPGRRERSPRPLNAGLPSTGRRSEGEACGHTRPMGAAVRRQRAAVGRADPEEIGRASCREGGCAYVEIAGVAVTLKKTSEYNRRTYRCIITTRRKLKKH